MITKQELSVILIRVLAAYLLLQAITVMPITFSIHSATPVGFIVSQEFVTFVISTTLWFAANPISKLMTKNITNQNQNTTNDSNQPIEIIIFTSIGLILIASSIPQLANMIVYNKAVEAMTDTHDLKIQAIASLKGYTVKYITKIIAGFFLLFFSHTIFESIQKIRGKYKKSI